MRLIRSLLFALLLLALFAVLLIANLGSWAIRSVFDTTTFVRTADAVLDAPPVHAFVAETVAGRIVEALAGPDGSIPRRVLVALELPPGTAMAEVAGEVERLVREALADPELADIRDRALRDLDATLTGAALGTGAVAIAGDTLVLDLDELITTIDELLDPGSPGTLFGEPLPADLGAVELARTSALTTVTTVARGAELLGWLLPAMAVLVGLLALLLARRRVAALAWLGAMALLVGLLCLAAVGFGQGAVAAAVAEGPGARLAVEAALDAFTSELQRQSVALALAGVVLLVVGLVGGWLTRPGPEQTVRAGV